MYKYKYQMFQGLIPDKFNRVYKELVIESETKLTDKEVNIKALNLIGTYPKSYHYKVELIKEENNIREHETKPLKVSLYFKDGTILKEAYIRCGQLMLNGETVEEIEEMLKTSKMIDFTTNYAQGKFIPINVETYYIKSRLDSDKEIENYVRETNFFNRTDNIIQYIKSHERTLRNLLNDIR